MQGPEIKMLGVKAFCNCDFYFLISQFNGGHFEIYHSPSLNHVSNIQYTIMLSRKGGITQLLCHMGRKWLTQQQKPTLYQTVGMLFATQHLNPFPMFGGMTIITSFLPTKEYENLDICYPVSFEAFRRMHSASRKCCP